MEQCTKLWTISFLKLLLCHTICHTITHKMMKWKHVLFHWLKITFPCGNPKVWMFLVVAWNSCTPFLKWSKVWCTLEIGANYCRWPCKAVVEKVLFLSGNLGQDSKSPNRGLCLLYLIHYVKQYERAHRQMVGQRIWVKTSATIYKSHTIKKTEKRRTHRGLLYVCETVI